MISDSVSFLNPQYLSISLFIVLFCFITSIWLFRFIFPPLSLFTLLIQPKYSNWFQIAVGYLPNIYLLRLPFVQGPDFVWRGMWLPIKQHFSAPIAAVCNPHVNMRGWGSFQRAVCFCGRSPSVAWSFLLPTVWSPGWDCRLDLDQENESHRPKMTKSKIKGFKHFLKPLYQLGTSGPWASY